MQLHARAPTIVTCLSVMIFFFFYFVAKASRTLERYKTLWQIDTALESDAAIYLDVLHVNQNFAASHWSFLPILSFHLVIVYSVVLIRELT